MTETQLLPKIQIQLPTRQGLGLPGGMMDLGGAQWTLGWCSEFLQLSPSFERSRDSCLPPNSPHFLLPGLFESNCRRVFWVSFEGCGGVSQLLRKAPSSRKKWYHLLGGVTPEPHVPVYGSTACTISLILGTERNLG